MYDIRLLAKGSVHYGKKKNLYILSLGFLCIAVINEQIGAYAYSKLCDKCYSLFLSLSLIYELPYVTLTFDPCPLIQ